MLILFTKFKERAIMKKTVLFLVLALTACALSHQNVSFNPADFIGQSEQTLFESYGAPDSVYNITPDTYVWTYLQKNPTPKQNPYTSEFLYQGWQEPQYGLPQVQTTYYCTYYFTIRNTIVTNYSFNGDDC